MEIDNTIRQFQTFMMQYIEEIEGNNEANGYYIVVDYNKVFEFNPGLAKELLINPSQMMEYAEKSIKDFKQLSPNSYFRIRIKHLPSTHEIRLSKIRSKDIGSLFCIEGIIKEKSEVRSQSVFAKFECPSCGNLLNVSQIEPKFKEPNKCGCGRKSQFRLISNRVIDVQNIILEESSVEAGQGAPRTLLLVLKGDLASPDIDKQAKIGSKLKCNGILNTTQIRLPKVGQSVHFDWVMHVNYLEKID